MTASCSEGVFCDTPECEEARKAIIECVEPFAEPPGLPEFARGASGLSDLAGAARTALGEAGVVRVRITGELTTEQFVTFARALGRPQPEVAASVAPYVEANVVLNLIAAHRTASTDLQPFSEQSIRLHTERSGARPDDQPRYLAFYCVHSPSRLSGGQTLLLPMQRLIAALSADARAVLRTTTYVETDGAPPILRSIGRREVLAFRDFGPDPLRWRAAGHHLEEEVNSRLRELTLAMYRRTPVYGITWAPGDLVVIDNTFFVHGRNRAVVPAGANPRHLRRIRIAAACPRAAAETDCQ